MNKFIVVEIFDLSTQFIINLTFIFLMFIFMRIVAVVGITINIPIPGVDAQSVVLE